jgi:hypothetical protein
MSAMDDDFDRVASDWRPRFTWPALFLIGWLLYEATAQPGLAAAVTCAKFGWADVKTALWLRRMDPDRGRGRACFWFYLAFGLWKVAVLATAMTIALLFLGGLMNPARRRLGGDVLSPVLGGVLIAAAVGFGLSFLTTYIALWSALRHRVRVWLGIAPHRARSGRYWPPSHGQTNAAPFVTVTTLILTLWAFVLALLALATRAGRFQLAFFIVLLAGVFLAFPGFLLVFRLLDHRVFAQAPRDCWTCTEDEAAYESADGEVLL